MSRVAKLLQPVAAARRSYSIFSSKSGGGRYFNSAKPGKGITPSTAKAATATKATSATTSNAAVASSTSPEPAQPRSEGESSAPKPSQTTTEPRSPFAPHTSVSPFGPSMKSSASSSLPLSFHPVPNKEDLTLHRFFSQHRPFLLLNQPTSALFQSAPEASQSGELNSLFSTADFSTVGTIDNPPVATAEADADAARQLSRALVVNRVGGLIEWEATLVRLGFNEGNEPLLAAETYEVEMDSTKRKRRKKMKKHKLKKRRRLTRASRMRLGK